MLLYLKLLAEAMGDLPGTHPGCLVASFAYESEQFDDEIRELMVQGALTWRVMFMELFERVAQKYPMKVETPLEELADMLTSAIEGGIIMSKVLDDPSALPKQILQYRNYIRLVFGDA